ncbi:MAG: hypothetical protein WA864_21265 [Acetobacteraceae bacterium]
MSRMRLMDVQRRKAWIAEPNTFRAVRAGTFDDISWLHPAAHFWTRSKQPWVVLPDERSQVLETQPSTFWAELSICGFAGPAYRHGAMRNADHRGIGGGLTIQPLHFSVNDDEVTFRPVSACAHAEVWISGVGVFGSPKVPPREI